MTAGLTRGQGKEKSARPWASAVANGHVQITPGAHVKDLLDEHATFPQGAHDEPCGRLLWRAATYIALTFRSAGARCRLPASRWISAAADARPFYELVDRWGHEPGLPAWTFGYACWRTSAT